MRGKIGDLTKLESIDLSKVDKNKNNILEINEQEKLIELMEQIQQEILYINKKKLRFSQKEQNNDILDRKRNKLYSLSKMINGEIKDNIIFIYDQLSDLNNDFNNGMILKVSFDIERAIFLREHPSKYKENDLKDSALFSLILKGLLKKNLINDIIKISKSEYGDKIFDNTKIFENYYFNNKKTLFYLFIEASKNLNSISIFFRKIDFFKNNGFSNNDIDIFLEKMSNSNTIIGFTSPLHIEDMFKLGIGKEKILKYIIKTIKYNKNSYEINYFFEGIDDFMNINNIDGKKAFNKNDLIFIFKSLKGSTFDKKSILLKYYSSFTNYFFNGELFEIFDDIFINLNIDEKEKYEEIKKMLLVYGNLDLISNEDVFFDNNIFIFNEKKDKNDKNDKKEEYLVDLDISDQATIINRKRNIEIKSLFDISKIEVLFNKIISRNIDKKELIIFFRKFIKHFINNYKKKDLKSLFFVLNNSIPKINNGLLNNNEDFSIKLFFSSLEGLENKLLSNKYKTANDSFFTKNNNKLPFLTNEKLENNKRESLGKIQEITFVLDDRHLKNIVEITKILAENGKNISLIYNDEKDYILVKKMLKNFYLIKKINFLKKEKISTFVDDIWIRDGAVQIDGKIVESFKNSKFGSSQSYDLLSIPMKLELYQSDLIFEGGNIRQSNKYAFIGYNDIYSNIKGIKTNKKIEKVKKRFEKLFNKEVIIIGLEKHTNGKYKIETEQQKIYHIDLYITPISDNEIIVGKYEEGNFKNIYLNKEANRLEKLGFIVYRSGNIEKDISSEGALTYNNCLIENYNDDNGINSKKVFLPQYNYKDIYEYNPKTLITKKEVLKSNEQAVELYKNLGFFVVKVPISADYINSGGSLDCITFEKR